MKKYFVRFEYINDANSTVLETSVIIHMEEIETVNDVSRYIEETVLKNRNLYVNRILTLNKL